MLLIDKKLTPDSLLPQLERVWELAIPKIQAIHKNHGPGTASPVFTIKGRYSSRGWTEWTQGFQYGAPLLVYDAVESQEMLAIGRQGTFERMAPHLTHTGVHDHGFNNVSTYGNLRRLMLEGRIPHDPRELDFYELALRVSGAVQASRWTEAADGDGYIYSFNGPHSLFCDTIRSLRSLAIAHRLGHPLMTEHDQSINLLDRLLQHARTTAKYNVYYGNGRDNYDVRGRVVHESIFNTNDGQYRCPSTQQGYSPFSTWTRGLAWIMLGCAEQLEYLAIVPDAELASRGGRAEIEAIMLEPAKAACDFYLANTPTDGIPYWDTGAPNLAQLGDYLDRPADPMNDYEPVDSSAAAIACQGLLRLGTWLEERGETKEGQKYWQAGLTVLRALINEPYLSTNAKHQGLLLHAVYHRPAGWDYIPAGAKSPRGESCMWGDYHLLEAALYARRVARKETYYTFFGPPTG